MRSAGRKGRGWFVESGRWEPLVAIILGFLLTVALGRGGAAALTVIAPGDDNSTGVSPVVLSPPATR